MQPKMLVGKTRDHVLPWKDTAVSIHRDVALPFQGLCTAAAEHGFDLRIASGFRDFEGQKNIWNAKVTGKRPLLDARGIQLDPTYLQPRELLTAILRWSALPGLSRHHWGTDIDIYDAAAVPPEYKLQLVPAEYQGTGPFAPLAAWLHTQAPKFGFFRPYATDRGGVSPEPWHFSYAPIAHRCKQLMSLDLIEQELRANPLELQDFVSPLLPEIFNRYFLNTDE